MFGEGGGVTIQYCDVGVCGGFRESVAQLGMKSPQTAKPLCVIHGENEFDGKHFNEFYNYDSFIQWSIRNVKSTK